MCKGYSFLSVCHVLNIIRELCIKYLLTYPFNVYAKLVLTYKPFIDVLFTKCVRIGHKKKIRH